MEWFDIETKVRKLVSDLLQPTIRRTQEDQEIIQNLGNSVDNLKRRVTDLDDNVLRATKKFKYIKDLKIRLASLDARYALEQKQLNTAVNAGHMSIEELKTDINFCKGDIVTQQKSMNIITKEQGAISERISSSREAFFQQIQDVKGLLEDKVYNIETEQKEHGYRIDKWEKLIANANEAISEANLALFKIETHNRSILEDVQVIKEKALDAESFKAFQMEVNQQIDQFQHDIPKIEMKIAEENEKQNKDLELKMHQKATDLLYAGLDDHGKRRLAEFELPMLQGRPSMAEKLSDSIIRAKSNLDLPLPPDPAALPPTAVRVRNKRKPTVRQSSENFTRDITPR